MNGAGDVKFLVYGNDLWRDPRVILRGQEAADGAIKVLPDMSGISVTFNIKDLPKFVPKTGNYLTVLTRSGTARYLIELVSCEKKAPPEPKPELEPAPVLGPARARALLFVRECEGEPVRQRRGTDHRCGRRRESSVRLV